jgi:hypothetical protein
MQINIHWGEFCGAVERTQIIFTPRNNKNQPNYPAFRYNMKLRGYLPFSLFKNLDTKAWVTGCSINSSISNQVIFYTKKMIDEFELKNKVLYN